MIENQAKRGVQTFSSNATGMTKPRNTIANKTNPSRVPSSSTPSRRSADSPVRSSTLGKNRNSLETGHSSPAHAQTPLSSVPLVVEEPRLAQKLAKIWSDEPLRQEKLRTLVKLGKKQGYLTLDDINEALPDCGPQPDEIEAIIAFLRSLEIKVIESSDLNRQKSPAPADTGVVHLEENRPHGRKRVEARDERREADDDAAIEEMRAAMEAGNPIPFLTHDYRWVEIFAIEQQHGKDAARLWLNRCREALSAASRAAPESPESVFAMIEAIRASRVLSRTFQRYGITPNLRSAWQNLGNLYYIHCTRYHEALECFEQAICLGGLDAPKWALLGRINLILCRYQDAKKAFSRAVSLNNKSACAWNGLAVAHKNMAEYEEAENCLRIALEIEPEYQPAVENLKTLTSKYLCRGAFQKLLNWLVNNIRG